MSDINLHNLFIALLHILAAVSNVTMHIFLLDPYEFYRAGKNHEFLRKIKKIGFFDLNRIFLI